MSRRICSTRSGSSASRPFHDPLFRGTIGKIENLGDACPRRRLFRRSGSRYRCRRCSSPRSTSLITSGLVCSMLAIRFTTSICLCAGQAHHDFAGLLRGKMGQDQGDRLRMLILNERQEIFRLGLLKERERRGLHLLGHLLDDPLGILFRQRFQQQGFRVFQPTFAHPAVGQREVVEFAAETSRRAGAPMSPTHAISRLTSSTSPGLNRLRI